MRIVHLIFWSLILSFVETAKSQENQDDTYSSQDRVLHLNNHFGERIANNFESINEDYDKITEPDITQKIVNGEAAKPHSWPWQISLQFVDGILYHICGGSIITNKIVLTAAHCLDPSKIVNYHIVAGAHHIKMNEEEVQTSKIENMILHKDYILNRTHILNDIAILFLERQLTFNDKVSPVSLPKKNSIANGTCYTTGWGETAGTIRGDQLNEVRLPVVDQKVCEKYFYITSSHLCTGLDKGKSGCKGDSGGPFVCLNTSDKRWYLHGITSFGNPMCNKISVFTRVVSYLDWIHDNIASRIIAGNKN